MLEIFSAFRTLVRGVVPDLEPWDVFDWSDAELGQAEKPTEYIALADFTPTRAGARLSSHYGVQGHMFAVTVVAEVGDEVRDAIDRIRNRVEGRRLVVSWDTSTRLRNETLSSQPVRQVEDSTAPRLFTALDVWKCSTTRRPPTMPA